MCVCVRVLSAMHQGVLVLSLQASIVRDYSQGIKDIQEIAGYQRDVHQFCQFKNYDLTYATFSRPVI